MGEDWAGAGKLACTYIVVLSLRSSVSMYKRRIKGNDTNAYKFTAVCRCVREKSAMTHFVTVSILQLPDSNASRTRRVVASGGLRTSTQEPDYGIYGSDGKTKFSFKLPIQAADATSSLGVMPSTR